jgi:hypothetical protein
MTKLMWQCGMIQPPLAAITTSMQTNRQHCGLLGGHILAVDGIQGAGISGVQLH